VEEFLEELTKSPPAMGKIVRGTVSYTSTSTFPIRHVSVISTFLKKEDDESLIVMLEKYCGQHLGFGAEDKKIMDKADKILKQIEDKVVALHLQWRLGVYE